MNRKLGALITIVLGQSAIGAALAQQTVNRSIDAPPAGAVRIELVEGDVTVRGWGEQRIEISGELGSAAQSLEVLQEGDRTTIRVIESESDQSDRSETELYVSLPRASRLTVDATNADILVASVDGALSLHTVSGDVEADSTGAEIEAETVGGDIRISGGGTSREATLTTVAGEIEVSGAFARITASTISGDIELDILDAAVLTLNATNGDIEVHATLESAAMLTAETINGDVELEVGEEGDLNLDVGTFSGRISTCFGDEGTGQAAETRDEGRGRDRRRRGTRQIGGELTVVAEPDSPTVRVRTLNGDIEICSS